MKSYYHTVSFGLSPTHKGLLSFLLAVFFLKGCNSFDELEWKLLVEGAVFHDSLPEFSQNTQLLLKDLKQILEALDFTIRDYLAPFKSYSASAQKDQEPLKSTRSIEKHEFSNNLHNLSKEQNNISKKLKRVSGNIYSKRASAFLLELVNELKKPPENMENITKPTKFSFEMNNEKLRFNPKYSSIYNNNLTNLIRTDFLIKLKEGPQEKHEQEFTNHQTNEEEKLEQEIFIMESPRKDELSKKSEFNDPIFEKNTIFTKDFEEFISENDSEKEEENNKKNFLANSEKKSFLLSDLIRGERFINKNRMGSVNFRIKPKKKTVISNEMNSILQNEIWTHGTGNKCLD